MRRTLTHVELLYRPGERHLAHRVLALLGCQPVDRGGTFFTSFIDPEAPRDYANNVLYASEVGVEQLELEQALGAMDTPARRNYELIMRREPQRSAHFGFRVPDDETLEALVDRVQHASVHDAELAGRVAVDGVFRPGTPGALATNMVQAFVWTDVVASGLLCLGQHIEIQCHLETAGASSG